VKRWYAKAAIQGVLSKLPDPQRWNRIFQEKVTHSLTLTDAYLIEKWLQARDHVANWRSLESAAVDDFAALEVGTGWFPITPLALIASGARHVTTIDLHSLLQERAVRQTLLLTARGIDEGWLDADYPNAASRFRDAATGANLDSLLTACGIEARIGNAAATGLPAQSIDLSVSNTTLEHIPAFELEAILTELARLCSPHGATCHLIDLSDHYAAFDRSITPYNYLRYPAKRWRLINNPLQYQNRLRASDYRNLVRRAGLRIDYERSAGDELSVLKSVPIAPEFRRYEEQDLLVHSMAVACRPASHTPAATH
jgi:hypothetical protein